MSANQSFVVDKDSGERESVVRSGRQNIVLLRSVEHKYTARRSEGGRRRQMSPVDAVDKILDNTDIWFVIDGKPKIYAAVCKDSLNYWRKQIARGKRFL